MTTWKRDALQQGYVNEAGVFLGDELVRVALVHERARVIARNGRMREAIEFTLRQFDFLAASLAAQAEARGKVPCPCCDAAGQVRVPWGLSHCCVCNGRGWYQREAEESR